MTVSDVIGTRPSPTCLVCGSAGKALHADLTDRVFSAPGQWTLVQCVAPDCGLLWLNPLPLEDEIGKAYSSYYTHANATSGRPAWLARLMHAVGQAYLARRYGYHPGMPMHRRALGWLAGLYPGYAAEMDISVMWLPASKRGRLLDVGSGSGWLVEQLNNLGWSAEGLDFDPDALEKARERGLTVHLGGLAEQRFADSTYDAITMCHSIEHVHAPLSWLQEARRILRPGGALVIATPNSASLGHRLFGRDWRGLEPPRHLQIFNIATLHRLLAAAGFSRVRVFTSARDAAGILLASRSIRNAGRFAMGARLPIGTRLMSRFAQLAASAVHRIRPDLGEELIAVAER